MSPPMRRAGVTPRTRWTSLAECSRAQQRMASRVQVIARPSAHESGTAEQTPQNPPLRPTLLVQLQQAALRLGVVGDDLQAAAEAAPGRVAQAQFLLAQSLEVPGTGLVRPLLHRLAGAGQRLARVAV